MIQVYVKGAVLDQVSDMPYILLQTSDKKDTIPISVGPAEATSIIMALEGIKASRPMTHDLLVHFFTTHGFFAEKIEIYDLVGRKFFAKLIYKKGWRRFKLELRPSDGLAMAVRLGTPVFIKEDLVKKAGALMEMYEGDRFFKQDKMHFNLHMFDDSENT